MIQKIIENTVGIKANMLFSLCKHSVSKYVNLDYEGLEFTDDIGKHFASKAKAEGESLPKTYDLILIDAENELKIVDKALKFALKKVGKEGVVVLANSLPPNRNKYVTPKRRPGNWYGEVWKVVTNLHSNKGTDFVTFPIGNGYTIIAKRANSIYIENPERIELSDYSKNRNQYARLVSAMELREWYDDRTAETSDTQAS